MSTVLDAPSESSSLDIALRSMCVLGFGLMLVLYFVPKYQMTVGGLFGFGGQLQTFSDLDAYRLFFRQGRTGLFLFGVGTFFASGAFLVLALTRPRRWVFVSGASFATFLLILFLFIGQSPDQTYLPIPRILDYVSMALPLSGFWAKRGQPLGREGPVR